jgi:hypothetical protein
MTIFEFLEHLKELKIISEYHSLMPKKLFMDLNAFDPEKQEIVLSGFLDTEKCIYFLSHREMDIE